MEKLTNVKALEMVLKMELSNELREKLEKMKATFERKNASGSNGKMTPNQEENEVIKKEILEVLGSVEKATVTEIQKALTNRPDISNQKVSALLTQMLGVKVIRFTEKRKAYFSIVKQD